LVFENCCHLGFQRRIRIEYVEMVRLAKEHGKTNPRWYSCHHVFDSHRDAERKKLNKLREKAVHAVFDLSPSVTVEYGDQEISPEPDIYYIPKKKNEVGIDSFICRDGHLYLFQFTVSDKHDIKDGLIERLKKFTHLPPRDKWCFIFVIPDDKKGVASSFSTSEELQQIKLFSAQVATAIQGIEGPLPKRPKITEAPVEGSNDGAMHVQRTVNDLKLVALRVHNS